MTKQGALTKFGIEPNPGPKAVSTTRVPSRTFGGSASPDDAAPVESSDPDLDG
jgi:hypothetical protein